MPTVGTAAPAPATEAPAETPAPAAEDSLDYGFFTSAYGWFNVFLLMLIFGGIILDKMEKRSPEWVPVY